MYDQNISFLRFLLILSYHFSLKSNKKILMTKDIYEII